MFTIGDVLLHKTTLMKSIKQYVNPPANCDICKQKLESEFSDCFVPLYRTWANVCPDCASHYRVAYGTGRGQRYVRSDDGIFYKVEG